MGTLEKNQRNYLKIAALNAREISENAARKAISALAVGDAKAYDYMTEEQKAQRRELRAHGRELGDERKADATQSIGLLVEECAYEHWHCMLFSRFLAENNLLMHPEMKVSVSLAECDDLAREEGYANRWECAASYASKMLPMIFRQDSPSLKLKFSAADMQALEEIVEKLDDGVFHASDSIGWCYQFWQEKRKNEINESEVKISERELSPVTQLFTEPYMVSFLLDNSIGAWYAAHALTEDDMRNTLTEMELRDKASLPGMPLEYLRFIKDDNGAWKIASGNYEKWPESLSEFSLLDPCCGSGHFLVAAFNMLVPIRMQLENIDAVEATRLVLTQNIHGLELDARCVEMAVFALAFAAWTYPNAGGWRELPGINVACCGRSIRVSKDKWTTVIKKQLSEINERLIFENIYELFCDAPILGSLIEPTSISDQMRLMNASDNLWGVFNKIADDESKEATISARGIASAASILMNRYTLVVTNVPYLKSGNQGNKLKEYCEKDYPKAKYDLATVFMMRCLKLTSMGGCVAIVTQQYWLFLQYYKKLRKDFIEQNRIRLLAQLGPGAFEEISGDIVNVCMLIADKKALDPAYCFGGVDLSEVRKYDDKVRELISKPVQLANQNSQLENPDYRISFMLKGVKTTSLEKFADFGKGSVSGDRPHYMREFWELRFPQSKDFWLNGSNGTSLWNGRHELILWSEKPEKEIGFSFRGQRVFGKRGIAIGKAGKLRFSPYLGEHFDDNIAVICPWDDSQLEAIWSFCVSDSFTEGIKALDKKMSVTAGTFTKIEFDADKWLKQKCNMGIRSPYGNDIDQWIFHGHPCKSVVWDEDKGVTTYGAKRMDSSVIQVGVCRLLGYQWPAEIDKEMELAAEQRHLADTVGAELGTFVDNDGIVCIPHIGNEPNAADRLLSLLSKAYGDDWSVSVLSDLLSSVGYDGKDLDSYLRTGFFKDHCKMFGNRPFIWQIWDGQNDGFSVLVNYHKLDNKLLTKLIYTVLGSWIQRQKDDLSAGVEGAQRRLDAANGLQRKLIAILEGEAPYDIFVRWKSLKEQSIGWNPDPNDGVRMNIRPFVTAGVLRDKFNINWKKDRGKDVASAPWYNEFGGERINDKHLTLAEKRSARENDND